MIKFQQEILKFKLQVLRMQSWRSVNFPAPMLAKTNRLQNPYLNHSNVTAVTSVTNFVHLNDRSRVDLNEQSDSEDQDLKRKLKQQFHTKINSGRLMTFSRNNQLVQIQEVSQSNYSNKNFKKASKLKQQDSDQNQLHQKVQKGPTVQYSSRRVDNVSDDEKIADEGEGYITSQKQEKYKKEGNGIIHFKKSSKPGLSSASQVISHEEECRLKQSIIERIREEGFAQSQVIDLQNYESRLIENNYIQQRNNNNKEDKGGMKNTKVRKRKSIFGHNQHSEKTKLFYNKEPKYEEKNSKSHFERQELKKQRKIGQDCAFHSRQVQKCLDIISKLTERNQLKNENSENYKLQKEIKSMLEMKGQIEHETLRISFLTDKILAQTTLDSLSNKEISQQINKLKFDIQSVLKRIGQLEQKKYMLSAESERGKGRAIQKIEFKQELVHQLQKISKILIYIQQIERRFKICSQKLSAIHKKATAITKVQKIEKIKIQAEISKCIIDLEDSKFQGKQADIIGLVQAYNKLIDEESGLLKQILDIQM